MSALPPRVSGASDASQNSTGGASGQVLSSRGAGGAIDDLLNLGTDVHQQYDTPGALQAGAQQGQYTDFLTGAGGGQVDSQSSMAPGMVNAPPTAFASPAVAAAVASAAGPQGPGAHHAPSLTTSLSARSNISTGSQVSQVLE
jgi:hypothetical protein